MGWVRSGWVEIFQFLVGWVGIDNVNVNSGSIESIWFRATCVTQRKQKACPIAKNADKTTMIAMSSVAIGVSRRVRCHGSRDPAARSRREVRTGRAGVVVETWRRGRRGRAICWRRRRLPAGSRAPQAGPWLSGSRRVPVDDRCSPTPTHKQLIAKFHYTGPTGPDRTRPDPGLRRSPPGPRTLSGRVR